MSAAVMEQPPQILARAAQGDQDSFSELIEPLLDPAYRLAAVMLADRGAAEDAVQEASVKAWRKLRQLRGDASARRPWFLPIVANESRMAPRTPREVTTGWPPPPQSSSRCCSWAFCSWPTRCTGPRRTWADLRRVQTHRPAPRRRRLPARPRPRPRQAHLSSAEPRTDRSRRP